MGIGPLGQNNNGVYIDRHNSDCGYTKSSKRVIALFERGQVERIIIGDYVISKKGAASDGEVVLQAHHVITGEEFSLSVLGAEYADKNLSVIQGVLIAEFGQDASPYTCYAILGKYQELDVSGKTIEFQKGMTERNIMQTYIDTSNGIHRDIAQAREKLLAVLAKDNPSIDEIQAAIDELEALDGVGTDSTAQPFEVSEAITTAREKISELQTAAEEAAAALETQEKQSTALIERIQSGRIPLIDLLKLTDGEETTLNGHEYLTLTIDSAETTITIDQLSTLLERGDVEYALQTQLTSLIGTAILVTGNATELSGQLHKASVNGYLLSSNTLLVFTTNTGSAPGTTFLVEVRENGGKWE